MGEEGLNMKKRVILVRFNQGFGFNGGGDGDGGGGGGNNNLNARVVGNLVLAILLTYFTMNGQLGWLLDAIVSIWVFTALMIYIFSFSLISICMYVVQIRFDQLRVKLFLFHCF